MEADRAGRKSAGWVRLPVLRTHPEGDHRAEKIPEKRIRKTEFPKNEKIAVKINFRLPVQDEMWQEHAEKVVYEYFGLIRYRAFRCETIESPVAGTEGP